MLWLVLSRFRNVSGIPVIIFKLSVNVSSLEKTPSLYLLATIAVSYTHLDLIAHCAIPPSTLPPGAD